MQRKKPPISSKLMKQPSPLNLFDAFGEGSEKYTTLPMAMSYVVSSGLPQPVINDIFKSMATNRSYRSKFGDLVHQVRDLFRGVRILGVKSKETVMLPVAELHRPQITGCKSEFVQSYTTSEDYFIDIKVFGVGAGASIGREIGFSDTFEANGPCLQFIVPVTSEWEQCEFTRGRHKGIKFMRSNVKSVGRDWEPIDLTTPEAASLGLVDKCGLNRKDIKLAKWETHPFNLPQKTTQTRALSINNSQTMEVSLQTKVLGAEIGPRAVVKYLKTLKASYYLVGPQNYLAYFPKNSLAYYWNWT